ncbi:hypothetical protein CC1G_09580 [Coprinopsis cinerea okayama7|uniref:Glycosyltransferase 61 catalytic domain-containing protein n=1 Tax=Coprinopsis cinerea (strain Okayama-7 / 130 / ATCC MYA-4618 / FGSC 9003) TaxID=240176 RepID=A8P991_COPC7|nr:hypothetical protein CC1G_09580 [Coprinopsis cinerea okayama7\|eukprot:XP_001839725.2 hypothetical protein CC1G_09580 [Coprinopsis cinerea okayama7\
MGLRRDQRLTFILILLGILFFLSVLLYNGGDHVASAYVRAKQWHPQLTLCRSNANPPSHLKISGDGTVDRSRVSSSRASGIGRSVLVSTRDPTTIPSVTIPGGQQRAFVDGFSMIDRLYLRNGTFYIVTNDPTFPPRKALIGKPVALSNGVDSEATDKEMQFLSPEEAPGVLGDVATLIPDVTVFLYDSPQFMHHFYHWWGEIILGMWRVYSTLALDHKPSSLDPVGFPLPWPTRFVMPAVSGAEWRDRAGIIGPTMRAAFPQASIEKADYWNDLIKLDTTVVFERSMIINRDKAHKHPLSGRWFKMVGGTMGLTGPEFFWEPLRHSLVRNTIGYVPVVDSKGRILASSLKHTLSSPSESITALEDDMESPDGRYDLPVVTYISRQGSGRRLVAEDHELLVKSLKDLEKQGVCTVLIPQMEKLSIREQIAIIAKTTILVGVHGNGLTHQLIMPPSLRSATFEIMDPPSYTFDYEMLARNMGHKHYAVHNDTFLTYPRGKTHNKVHFTKGFHGVSIPVYGPAVADMIRRRLTEPDDAVED